MSLQDVRERWNKVLKGNCVGCQKRKAAIRKLLRGVRANNKVALMFSGGLDSTYALRRLMEDGMDITLYHVKWQYDDLDYNKGEQNAAHRIADWYNIPIVDFAVVNSPVDQMSGGQGGKTTDIMRLPTIGAMLICHRSLAGYGYIATGLHPSKDPRDAHWADLLQHMCDHCMPGTKMIYPSDGQTRRDMAIYLHEEVRSRLYICNHEPRCGKCDKCVEDDGWLKLGPV